MSSSARLQVSPTRTKRDRVPAVVFALLCVGIALGTPLPYVMLGLEELAEVGGGLAEHYAEQSDLMQAALFVHIIASGLALLLMPVQSSGSVRRRSPRAHRVTGRIAAAAIVLGGLSGLVIAQVSYAGWSGAIGFSMLSLLWLGCLVRSISEARAGRIASHRQWSLRVMALTFAAVTLRLWLFGYMIVASALGLGDVDEAFDQIYVLLPFLSWIPNVVFIEWYLRRSKAR